MCAFKSLVRLCKSFTKFVGAFKRLLRHLKLCRSFQKLDEAFINLWKLLKVYLKFFEGFLKRS